MFDFFKTKKRVVSPFSEEAFEKVAKDNPELSGAECLAKYREQLDARVLKDKAWLDSLAKTMWVECPLVWSVSGVEFEDDRISQVELCSRTKSGHRALLFVDALELD